MNYKVLYRKYRPNSFTNLVGQRHIVEILKNSISEQKIAHAYIFSGPRGTGKTSTARILAKAVNCLDPKDGMACEKCANCKAFLTSPDVIEIDAASNNGVDEIRELIDNIKIMPTFSKYKVYIIDEVHMLSQSAFNALLLTLEEPPEHVIFILATTNLESVPITILSRCQKYDFKRIAKNDIVERLKFICEEEKISYEENALNEIAVLSDGGLRDALSILDQLSKNSDKISLDVITKEIGTVSNQKIEETIEAIDENNYEKVENMINELREINLNYKVFIKKMIEQLGKRAYECLSIQKSSRLTYDEYKKMVIELNDVINKINISVDPYMLIEMILLSYTSSNTETNSTKNNTVELSYSSEDAKKSMSESIFSEKNQETASEARKKEYLKESENKGNEQEIIKIRINNCFVNATKENLYKVKKLWDTFEHNNFSKIRGLISDTIPVAASNDYIILITTIPHKETELNEELQSIENGFNNANTTSYKLIFISEAIWQEEKQKYINNLQKGYKYKMIDETQEEIAVKEKETSENIEDIAKDIFGTDKVEVQ